MMKPDNIHKRPQAVEVMVHILAWGIVFAFPIAMMSRGGLSVEWHDYMRSLLMVLAYAMVFYVNYFIFVPRFLSQGRIKKMLAGNVALIVAMVLALHFGMEFLSHTLLPNRPPHPMGPPKTIFMLRDIGSMILTAGLSAAIKMSRRWTQLEAARREAEQRRTEAELKNLRNQLNPHFLLNTLNNIYALIAFDTNKAQQAVQDLSRLLRHVLYDNQQETVSLFKEMDFIRNYIELMRIRLSANVEVETRYSAPHLHLPHRECFQTWHLAHKAQLHPHLLRGKPAGSEVRDTQQLLPQDRSRQERKRHRPGTGAQASGTDLSRPV